MQSTTMAENLEELWMNRYHAEHTIPCRGGPVRCHQRVLGSACSEECMADLGAAAVLQGIRYLYLGKIALDRDIYGDVLKFATRLGRKDLLREAVMWLPRLFGDDLGWSLRIGRLGRKLGMENVWRTCDEKVAGCFHEGVWLKPEFVALDHDHLYALVHHPRLLCHEFQLFEALGFWLHHPSGEDRWQHAQGLMESVMFGVALNPTYMESVLESFPRLARYVDLSRRGTPEGRYKRALVSLCPDVPSVMVGAVRTSLQPSAMPPKKRRPSCLSQDLTRAFFLDTSTRLSWVYNSIGDCWDTIPSPPTPREGFSACCLGDCIYVAGGTWKGEAVTSVERYVRRGRWSTVTEMPFLIVGGGMAAAFDRIWLLGGSSRDGPLRDVWCYDPASNKWSKEKSTGLRHGAGEFELKVGRRCDDGTEYLTLVGETACEVKEGEDGPWTIFTCRKELARRLLELEDRNHVIDGVFYAASSQFWNIGNKRWTLSKLEKGAEEFVPLTACLCGPQYVMMTHRLLP